MEIDGQTGARMNVVKLEANLTRIFSDVQRVPDGKVVEIWSHGYCEDNLTYMLNVVLEDGSDLFISACPGQPVRIGVQGRG